MVRKGSDPEVREDLDRVFFKESIGVLLGSFGGSLWWVGAVAVGGRVRD